MRHIREIGPANSQEFSELLLSLIKCTVHVKKCQDELENQVSLINPNIQRYVECLEEHLAINSNLTDVISNI